MVTPENAANVEERDGFAERLRQVAAAYGSTSSLARTLGRSEGALRKWLRGKSEPNVSDLRAICELTGTNVEWLVTGRGVRTGPVSVRESTSGQLLTGSRAPFDYRLHDEIMATIDEELRSLGLEIARIKRSSMIGMLYDRFQESKQVDREVVSRMVRLAQA
jgi:transcriptional regulator with XRE-family HTH domain